MKKPPFPGQMIRLHYCLDLFMRGVAYAEVVSVGRKNLVIHHHGSNTTHRLPLSFWGTKILPADESFC